MLQVKINKQFINRAIKSNNYLLKKFLLCLKVSKIDL